MKRRIFLLSFLLIFLDCKTTKLLRLFSGNLPAMFLSLIFFVFSIWFIFLKARKLEVAESNPIMEDIPGSLSLSVH